MNIIVTIKQVPNTTSKITIDPETGTLNREGVPSIVNPEDKNAIEAALCLKEKHGGKITALSMGPPQAKAALREAMAMGVDEAILLSDRKFAGADTLATAYALSCAIKKIKNFDLIIGGRQAIDGDTAQTGPQLSEFLKIPQITYVEDIEVDGKNVRVKSKFGNICRTIEAKMPALLTVTKEMNTPRYSTLRGIWSAHHEKEIVTWTSDDVKANPLHIGLSGSPTQVKKIFTPTHEREGKKFTGTPMELARSFIDFIYEHNLIEQ